MIPEGGKGGIAEGSREADERREEHSYEYPAGGAAPRGGMQGKKDRGAAPSPTLPRPGTTPAGTPGTGGEVAKRETPQAPEGGRVQDPEIRDNPDIRPSR